MSACILAIDHGTSGLKASLVDRAGQVLASAFRRLPTLFLDGGGAEQDPADWWRALIQVAHELLSSGVAAPDEVRALCVSSTFSTTVAVGEDGTPLMNALTWMDSRGAPHVRRLMRGLVNIEGYGLGRLLRWVPLTGGGPTLSGKDDAAHALWLMHERPSLYRRARALLPSKDYLNLRLCGKLCASYDSMQLFWVTDIRDPRRVRYNPGLIRTLGLDADKLPPLCAPTDVLGPLLPEVAQELGLPSSVQVVAGSPDHQAAAVGAGAVRDFDAHLYVGTSSWLQCIVPFKKTDPFHSIASFPTAVPGRYTTANEQDSAGGCLDHLARLLGREPGPETYRALDALAAEAEPGAGGLIYLPWLGGERTPVDDPRLRGGFLNLGRGTGPRELARAVLEGVAYNTRWTQGHLERFVGQRLDRIAMVGGGACSDLWCRLFAQVLDRDILQVDNPLCANARGAAFIAWVGLGELTFEAIPSLITVKARYEPDPALRPLYAARFRAFLDAHRRLRPWFHTMNPLCEPVACATMRALSKEHDA